MSKFIKFDGVDADPDSVFDALGDDAKSLGEDSLALLRTVAGFAPEDATLDFRNFENDPPSPVSLNFTKIRMNYTELARDDAASLAEEIEDALLELGPAVEVDVVSQGGDRGYFKVKLDTILISSATENDAAVVVDDDLLL